MSLLNYLKEKWLFCLFVVFAFLFSFLVYRLDSGLSISDSNARYILAGWLILLVLYLIADLLLLRMRAVKFSSYCRLKTRTDPRDEFYYPEDRQKAELVQELVSEYECYQAAAESKAADEKEFITRWLHDIKVPISAAKLVLESQENKLPPDFYRNMDQELFAVEESVMRVFYEMKSNRFSDDYKIIRTNTKKLIARALKTYSSFFRYKGLGIDLEGEEHEILTDEKWSSYILSQIISNAIKYSPEGGRIELSTTNHAGRTTISVKNLGKGISRQDIGQVFKKGFTASDGRSGAKATGYGLYLAKKLCDLLGHSLTAESIYNEYAVFHLSFTDSDTLYNSYRDTLGNVTEM